MTKLNALTISQHTRGKYKAKVHSPHVACTQSSGWERTGSGPTPKNYKAAPAPWSWSSSQSQCTELNITNNLYERQRISRPNQKSGE